MLVLSRKVDQKISIGDDITLTVVRIDGNRVRIGVDAPKDVRILRGELSVAAEQQESGEYELSQRELAFAHPQPAQAGPTKSRPTSPPNPVLAAAESKVFSGTVSRDGETVLLNAADSCDAKAAPLAGFVSAT